MVQVTITGRDVRHLAAELRRWVRVIAGQARPRGARNLFLTHNQYKDMHSRLLATCRDISKAADAAHKPQFQRLERLLQPWGSLETLRATDRQILRDLVANCLVIEGTLSGRKSRGVSWVAIGLAVFAGAALFGCLRMQNVDFEAAVGISSELRNWCHRMIFEVRQASPLKKSFVIVGIFLVFSIQLLRRTRTD